MGEAGFFLLSVFEELDNTAKDSLGRVFLGVQPASGLSKEESRTLKQR